MAYYEPDTRVKTLAATLRANGMAMSDSEAMRMAQEMCHIESKVQTHNSEMEESATWSVGKALQGVNRNGRVSFADAAAIGSVPNPTPQGFETEVKQTARPAANISQEPEEVCEPTITPLDIPEFSKEKTVEELMEGIHDEDLAEPKKVNLVIEDRDDYESTAEAKEPEGQPETSPDTNNLEPCGCQGVKEVGTPNTEKDEYNTPIRNDADPSKFAEANIDLASIFGSK